MIDVGCGDNFTFVIACPKEKQITSKVLRKFQEDCFENVKSTVHNIQEWKKKKLILEAKTIPTQGIKSPSANSPNYIDLLLSPNSDSIHIKSPNKLMSNSGLRGSVIQNNERELIIFEEW